MKKTIAFLLSAMLLSLFAHNSASAQHKLESWYVLFDFGYANPQYSGELDEALKDFAALPGVSHAMVGAADLGFYGRIGEQTAIGVVFNSFSDRFTIEDVRLLAPEEGFTDLGTSLGGITIAISAMHFFNGIVGKGFFVRADAGPALFITRAEANVSPVDDATERGVGALVGGGYSIPVGSGTRFLVNANYAFRRVGSHNLGTFAITVGVLF